MREVMRSEGDLMARYGGEEFVALVPNRRLATVQKVAERLRAAVEATEFPPSLSQSVIHVTISVGAASVYPLPGMLATDLLRAADDELYQAKASGRNCVRPLAVESESKL
jgi:diguanylate cyclase (GGDEF)-like protein